VVALIVALIVFAAVGAAVWFLDSDEPTESTTSAATATAGASVPALAPRIVSAEQLRRLASSSSRPLYWAGPRTPARLEFTRRTDGTTYVRYLTGRARAGNRSAGYVVVATYAQPDAYGRVSAIASRKHLAVKHLANGGIAVTRPGRPQNIYLVYPDQPYQVEVYAPTAGEARRLVFSGAVAPLR
jgi:hypothetical protein